MPWWSNLLVQPEIKIFVHLLCTHLWVHKIDPSISQKLSIRLISYSLCTRFGFGLGAHASLSASEWRTSTTGPVVTPALRSRTGIIQNIDGVYVRKTNLDTAACLGIERGSTLDRVLDDLSLIIRPGRLTGLSDSVGSTEDYGCERISQGNQRWRWIPIPVKDTPRGPCTSTVVSNRGFESPHQKAGCGSIVSDTVTLKIRWAAIAFLVNLLLSFIQ